MKVYKEPYLTCALLGCGISIRAVKRDGLGDFYFPAPDEWWEITNNTLIDKAQGLFAHRTFCSKEHMLEWLTH